MEIKEITTTISLFIMSKQKINECESESETIESDKNKNYY